MVENYNNNEKKLTWKQHQEKRRKYLEKLQKQEETPGVRHGHCDQCLSTSFSLVCQEHMIVRTCKSCGAKRHF